MITANGKTGWFSTKPAIGSASLSVVPLSESSVLMEASTSAEFLYSVLPITVLRAISTVPDLLSDFTELSLPTGALKPLCLPVIFICATAITVRDATAIMNIQRAETMLVLSPFPYRWCI